MEAFIGETNSKQRDTTSKELAKSKVKDLILEEEKHELEEQKDQAKHIIKLKPDQKNSETLQKIAEEKS